MKKKELRSMFRKLQGSKTSIAGNFHYPSATAVKISVTDI